MELCSVLAAENGCFFFFLVRNNCYSDAAARSHCLVKDKPLEFSFFFFLIQYDLYLTGIIRPEEDLGTDIERMQIQVRIHQFFLHNGLNLFKMAAGLQRA